MRTGLGVAAFVAASAAACSLVTDLGGLAAGSDASVGDAAQGDGAPPGDALPDVPLPDACAGAYACAAAAPTGWSGPFALYDGNPSNAPTGCPTLAAVNVVTGYVGVDGGAATCGACTGCSVTFTAPMIGYGGDGGVCPTQPTCDASVASGTCVDVTQACPGPALEIRSPSFSCNAAAPNPTVPPVTYDEQAVGCAAQQIVPIDCPAGNVCVPTPSPPFAPQLCVAMSGDVACPGAPYSVKHLFETHIDDTRGCGACPCTTQNAGSTWSEYGSTTCSGFASGLNPVNNGCIYPSDTHSMSFKGTATGTCTATGPSSATGSVTATTPYTVCCQP